MFDKIMKLNFLTGAHPLSYLLYLVVKISKYSINHFYFTHPTIYIFCMHAHSNYEIEHDLLDFDSTLPKNIFA